MTEKDLILIVVSKYKKYIKETYGMSTASNVGAKLTQILQNLSAEAVERAKSDKRKTVMDRDF